MKIAGHRIQSFPMNLVAADVRPLPLQSQGALSRLTSAATVQRVKAQTLPALLVVALGCASQVLTAKPVELFDLAEVRLLDGPFKNAQDRGRDYLLAHDVDRMVAPFRREAGLEPKAPRYPNWESTGLDGHTGGHYLTALAQMWAATGDTEMKRRLDYMVSELVECQRAFGDGYVGGVPGSRELWRDVAAGRLHVESFSLNGKWVPWYNLHKTFAGLRDAWLIGKNAAARDVLIKLADWCDRLVPNLTEAQLQNMLRSEHGGMNEVLADVYAITGDVKYLALAERFSHRAILDPLLRHEDRLTGLHANTQIPKVVGFARIAELGGDGSWLNAARFFRDNVILRRSVAFGGNSVREHFNSPDSFSELMESREGPETCNTYNMLRLTERLFRSEPAALHGDYYERALYNHILASIHPEHGGFVYFTPLRPRHYRVYSQPKECFWCCVGSGMENHGKHGQFIYAHSEDALYVNLFIASELDWKKRGLKLRQETSFPYEPRTVLTLALEKPSRFTLRLRHPNWCSQLEVRLNGERVPTLSSPSSFLSLTREWRNGDRIELDLPMRTTIERLPDGSDYVAVMHGPIVLAAKTGTEKLDGLIAGDGRMAHIAHGPTLPRDEAPMFVGDFASLADRIQSVPGKPLTFTAPELIQPKSFASLELIPFYRLHDSRYMMYWRTVSAEKAAEVLAQIEARERERQTLEARTLDQVTPGEQQPEVEHNFQGEQTNTGLNQGRPWRDAGDGGWFSYDLTVDPQAPVLLRCTYLRGGPGERNFDILIDDTRIATQRLRGGSSNELFDETYEIPPELTRGKTKVTVRFVPHSNSRAGALFGVRLLRAEAQ